MPTILPKNKFFDLIFNFVDSVIRKDLKANEFKRKIENVRYSIYKYCISEELYEEGDEIMLENIKVSASELDIVIYLDRFNYIRLNYFGDVESASEVRYSKVDDKIILPQFGVVVQFATDKLIIAAGDERKEIVL